MPRIDSYPEATSMADDDILVIDGDNGTRKVKKSKFVEIISEHADGEIEEMQEKLDYLAYKTPDWEKTYSKTGNADYTGSNAFRDLLCDFFDNFIYPNINKLSFHSRIELTIDKTLCFNLSMLQFNDRYDRIICFNTHYSIIESTGMNDWIYSIFVKYSGDNFEDYILSRSIEGGLGKLLIPNSSGNITGVNTYNLRDVFTPVGMPNNYVYAFKFYY